MTRTLLLSRQRSAAIACCASLCIFAWCADSTRAADLLVPGDFATIAAAVAAAEDGDTIIVAPGTYTETVNPLGKAITIRSTDPADPAIVAATIIDGEGVRRGVEFIASEQPDTVLDGFTITGGFAEDVGGGLAASTADPTIRRCVFRGNTAYRGGAVYLYVSSSQFDRCVFEDNTAVEGAGGYAYACGWLRFDGCTFRNNTADTRGCGFAGDIATIRFERSLIAGNTAGSEGGGYHGDDALPYFVSSVIRDNSAPRGGAFYFQDDNGRIVNSTIVRNEATIEGSVIAGIFSQSLIRNSIIRDNGAAPFAGFSVTQVIEYSNVEGADTSDEGVIDTDPLFVDPAADNFRLQPDSPSIDTGFNGWVPSYSQFDVDDARRLSNATVDMGAYEFQTEDPPAPEPVGQVVVTFRDDGSLAYGREQPILLYEAATGEWSEILRNFGAYAIAADRGERCFWAQSGETGLLCKIPYDTLIIEEIGRLEFFGRNSTSLSGMAVRDGTLYASTAISVGGVPPQPAGLYTVNTADATLELVFEFPAEFQVWDLEYDRFSDRFLLLSNASFPGGPLGVYALDPETGDITEVQQWFNPDPFSEAPALQGLAAGPEQRYLFRSIYNDLEIYAAETGELVDEISVPPSVADPGGSGWVLGGLTWIDEFDGERVTLAGDMNCDGTVDGFDIDPFVMALATPDIYEQTYPDCNRAAGDMNDDGTFDAFDIDPFVLMLSGS